MNKYLLLVLKVLVGAAAFIGGYVLVDIICGYKIDWPQVLITSGIFAVVETIYYIFMDNKQGKR